MKPKNISQLRDKMFRQSPCLNSASKDSGFQNTPYAKTADSDMVGTLRSSAYSVVSAMSASVANEELPHYDFVAATYAQTLDDYDWEQDHDQSVIPRRVLAEKILLESYLGERVCERLAFQHLKRPNPRGAAEVDAYDAPVINAESDCRVTYGDLGDGTKAKLNKKYRKEICDLMSAEQSKKLETLLQDSPEFYEEKLTSYNAFNERHYESRNLEVPQKLLTRPEAGLFDASGTKIAGAQPVRQQRERSSLCGSATSLGRACQQRVAQGTRCHHHS